MERIEENLLEVQNEVEKGLYRYSSAHYYTHYNDLSDNTKKFLRSQRHILKLKGMLKELEESNKTQLEEKEEEITRLNIEK
jgi:hypothetical protein